MHYDLTVIKSDGPPPMSQSASLSTKEKEVMAQNSWLRLIPWEVLFMFDVSTQ